MLLHFLILCAYIYKMAQLRRGEWEETRIHILQFIHPQMYFKTVITSM